METQSIGFIGGGRITKILLTAFRNVSKTFKQVIVFDPQEAVLNALKLKFEGITITSTDLAKAASADVVFLAVHPPVMMETLAKIKDVLKPDSILVSLAPKFTILKMSEALGGFPNIARVNPSASSIINKGINPVCFSPSMAEDNKALLISLMQPFGVSPEVKDFKIEAYAMISAMGHTYFWFQIQKLKELAIEFGMEEKEAETVISKMLHGSCETLFTSGLTYAEVVDMVPVKPLGEVEETIRGYYDQYLISLFNKIKS
ncbi:MAG: NAD(P)-binding domain-containing protein [Bacteroidetes bacterium]|nr:NAD(P)-binding domain-containing protein [Bacteroidota bacterium]